MTTFLAAIVVAVALIVSLGPVVTEMRAAREEARRARVLSIVQLFGPAVAAVQGDPRALLVWQPLAATVRRLFPEECASLDAAAGSSFPFSADVMSTAHARWTADWLACDARRDVQDEGGRRSAGRGVARRPGTRRGCRTRETGSLSASLRGIHPRGESASEAVHVKKFSELSARRRSRRRPEPGPALAPRRRSACLRPGWTESRRVRRSAEGARSCSAGQGHWRARRRR